MRPNNTVNRFTQVPSVNAPRSQFDMSHRRITTFDVDYIYPIFVQETLPGDGFSVTANIFGRVNTPIFPIMDNLIIEIFWFEVQLYQVWDNARRFFGERIPDPDTTIDITIPQFSAHTPALNSLSDFMDIPTGDQLASDIQYNSIYHRGYNLIYNEWFRDQNLEDSVTVDLDDGPDDIADYVLLKANKKHDYFTSAATSPQKGDAVNLPLGTVAPVMGIGAKNQTYSTGTNAVYETGQSTTVDYTAGYKGAIGDSSGDDAKFFIEEDAANSGFPGIFADLTNAQSATINQWREAIQIQVLLERDMRGGTRYSEIIQSHFGIRPPELPWRPTLLNGSRDYARFSPIAQTSSTDATTPQGNLSAVGTFGTKSGFSKSFDTHGFVIGLMVVRADLTYSQGIERKYTRQTRYDYYWPAFAMLGEQEVLNQEIFMDGSANDTSVFGYQERHAEYRFGFNKLTSLMRPHATGTLAAWNLSEDFSSLPTLSQSYIKSATPMDRVVAVTTEPDFIADIWFDFKADRPMPIRSIPASLTRF